MRTESLIAQRHSLPGLHAHVFAARNLTLLNAIETTLDALRADTGLIASIERTYDEIYDILIEAAQELTQDGIQLCLTPVEKASDAVSRLWCDARDRQQSANADLQLRPDDGVTEAWQELMDALHSLHAKIEEVRDWLEDMAAIREPHESRVFTNVDDLVASIMSES